MKKILIALALGAASIGSVAHADIGIDARQLDQQRQIDAGKRSGKLSLSERQTLTREQKQIKAVEARLRVRGNNLSERDERRLNAMLDQAQRNIDRMKKNRVRGRDGVRL